MKRPGVFGYNAGMFPAYVINLDRDTERAAAFFKRAEAASLSVERVSGYDAAAHEGPFPADVVTAPNYNKGAIGCALSHRALWQKCVDTGPLIVFEDDAHMRGDFVTAVPQVMSRITGLWDIVLFGYNTNAQLNLRVEGAFDTRIRFAPRFPTDADLATFVASRDPAVPFRLVSAFGNCGYAISPPGARKLLANCFPLDGRILNLPGLVAPIRVEHIDSMMNWFYPTLTAYACVAPLVLSPNVQETSHTATSERVAAGARDRHPPKRRQRPAR